MALVGCPVTVGRTGEPKSAGQLVRIFLAMVRVDVLDAVHHYYLVTLAGARLVPRPLRLVLYRLAGVQVRLASIAPGSFIGRPASHLTIGHGTTISTGCFFDSFSKVTIGRNVMIGMGVTIVTSEHSIGSDGRADPRVVGRDVVVGDGAWLGARSVILPGVTVGEGTVISAGSVVTRDCGPFAIYAGVPARLIQHLQGEQPAGG